MADIELTTTAVSPLTTSLTGLRNRLRVELHDEDDTAYRWQDAALERHIERAVRELSRVAPPASRALAQASAVAPVVSTSSISRMRLPAIVAFAPGAAAKAACMLRRRPAPDLPAWLSVARRRTRESGR